MRSATHLCPACQSVMPVDGTGSCTACGAAASPETDLHTLVTQVPPVVRPAEGVESATELVPINAPPPTGPLLAAAKLPDEIGRLGPYRVLARIGVGGMGLVFRAEDPHLRRLVALKVMLPQFTADPTARARFLREARAAAAVEHDHIVPIFQVGEDRGVPYLAMPLLKGESLATRLKATGPLPLFHAVRIAREVAAGLAAAHAAGLIHRDVKPSNIWLEGSLRRVRLLDFGLARVVGPGRGDSSRLLDQEIVGTPAYMSPEQAGNGAIDGRSDLFSLGVVLYQMVSGHLPFKSGTAVVTLTSIATDTPQPPVDLNPDLPAELNTLILSLLAKRAEDRPPSAADVARRLADLEVELTAVPLPSMSEVLDDPFADLHQPDTVVVPDPRKATKTGARRWTRLGWIAAVGFVGALVGVRIGAALLLPAPPGTLIVDSEDSAAQIVIKRNGATVRDQTADRKIALKPGDYTLELADPKTGLRLSTQSVTITKNGRVTIQILKERPIGPPDPERDRRAAERFLALRGFRVRVRIGDAPEVELVGGINPVPKERFTVTGLTVPLSGVFTADDVKLVAGLAKMTALDATGKHLGDDGIRPLADMKALTLLKLGANDITDAGLKALKNLTTLNHLILDSNRITDSGIAELAGLTKLQILGLMETRLTNDGLAHLLKLPELTILNVSKLPITDAGVEHLTGLKKLVMLGVTETGLTDVGFERIAGLPELTHIFLANTKVSDTGLTRLPQTTKLTALDLTGTPMTDVGLDHLTRLKQVTTLAVKSTKVTAAGVQKFIAGRPDRVIASDHGDFGPIKK